MKYKTEYLSTGSKEGFLRLCLKNYPDSKPTSNIKRYYDMKKKFGNQIQMYDKTEKIHPSKYKLMQLEDMIRLKCNLTIDFLDRHGFNKGELNWLREEGWLE